MLESKCFNKTSKWDLAQVVVWERERPELPALLATDMIARWGMVAAMPDGEDTVGRAKLRVLTPAELVERAVRTADLFVAAIRDKGWVHITETAFPADGDGEEGSAANVQKALP